MDLTNEDVADILALLDSLPYDELDLQTPRFRLTLRRAPGGGWTEQSHIFSEPTTVFSGPTTVFSGPTTVTPAANGTSGAAAEPPTAVAASSGEDRPGLVAVTAPLPGTFYRAPRPGAAPFVEVGDVVSEDTVVAIVETMKLMNSVHAGSRGRVAEICLGNAEPTAQGATLMWIEPERA